jgi:hypothetical protein
MRQKERLVVETKAIIQADWDTYDKKYEYKVRPYLSSDSILIEERILHFESPTEKVLRLQTYKQLLAKKNKVLADAQVEANEIQEQANELLALEDHSQQQGVDDDIPF